MKVKHLIDKLNEYDPNYRVFMEGDVFLYEARDVRIYPECGDMVVICCTDYLSDKENSDE